MTELRMSGFTPGEEMNGLNAIAEYFMKPEGEMEPVVAIVLIDTARSGYNRVKGDTFAEVRLTRVEPILDEKEREKALTALKRAYEKRENKPALELVDPDEEADE